MWRYEKRLQYPVKITNPNPQLAQFIASQYGGPDGESAASMRYLSQRYAMPYDIGKAVLTDVGTEAPEMLLVRGSFSVERVSGAEHFRIPRPCSSI